VLTRQAVLSRLSASIGENHRGIVLTLLLIQASLLGYSATRHSPVHLEPAFLASGISHWELGRFELYRVNPPLPRMIASLPALVAGCETDWKSFYESPGARPEFAIGEDFIRANGPRSLWLFTLARWACIPINLIGAFIAYRWSRELYGIGAGLLTLVLFVFDPNLLAYGEFATPDCAFTAFGLLAGYTFWRWLKKPGWFRALLAGGSLALAELSKLSWIPLFGLWPVLWGIWCYSLRGPPRSPAMSGASTSLPPPPCPPFAQLIAILFVAVYGLNLGYLFDGIGTPLKEYEFVSTTLTGLEQPGKAGNRFRSTWLGSIPVPLPRQYVLGIDTQQKDLQEFAGRSYLRGEWKEGGWWYYYAYGWLVKEPISNLILVLMALLLCPLIRKNHQWRDELVVVAPALVLFIATSACTEFNLHWRYILPCIAFMLVFAGRCIFYLTSASVFHTIITQAAALSAISMLWSYPAHLTYFNILGGGPYGGYRHLLGSSLDWGQDLIELSHQIEVLKQEFPRIIVIVPARCSPESLGLFPPEVTIVTSQDADNFPADALVIRSRSLFPTLESAPGKIPPRLLHATWSIHIGGPAL
jgi:hypothetical protein